MDNNSYLFGSPSPSILSNCRLHLRINLSLQYSNWLKAYCFDNCLFQKNNKNMLESNEEEHGDLKSGKNSGSCS